ncbi:MAG: ribonucleotide reductase N-terminal alpha domain-containing protein, partial [Culicoidibacterales bacterium]
MSYLEKNNLLFQQVDGFYDLSKDIEARDEFLAEVAANTRQFESEAHRLQTLIAEGYYIDFYQNYDEAQIEFVRAIVGERQFQFQSFMAASKFYRDYAMKSDDHKVYLETYEQRIVTVALALAENDAEKACEYATAMIDQRF